MSAAPVPPTARCEESLRATGLRPLAVSGGAATDLGAWPEVGRRVRCAAGRGQPISGCEIKEFCSSE